MFRSPDGSEFTDFNAYRKYLFVNYFSFRNESGKTLQKNPGEINGQEFQLDNLTECNVMVLDRMDRVVASRLQNCNVFLGPCAESVMIRKCTGCTITLAAKEVRVEDCEQCTVRAFSPAPVQLNNCHSIRVGRFNGAYSGLTEHFSQVGLEPTGDSVQVMDYSSRDDSLPKPHFVMLSSSEEANEQWPVELQNATGPPENPVLNDGPTASPPPPINPPPSLDPVEPIQTGPADDQVQDEFFSDNQFAEENASGNEFGEQNQMEDAFAEQESSMNEFEEQQAISEDDPALFSDHQPSVGNSSGEDSAFATSLEQGATQNDHGQQDDFFYGEVDPNEDPFGETQYQDAGQAGYVENQQAMNEAFGDDQEDIGEGFGNSHQDASDIVYQPPQETYQPPLQAASMPPAAAPIDGSEPLAKWEEGFKELVLQKDEEHKKFKASLKEKAEEDLDEHYEERTQKNAIRFTTNRDTERTLLETQEPKLANSWERVVSLVDIKASKEEETRSRARMRGLLLQLKNN